MGLWGVASFSSGSGPEKGLPGPADSSLFSESHLCPYPVCPIPWLQMSPLGPLDSKHIRKRARVSPQGAEQTTLVTVTLHTAHASPSGLPFLISHSTPQIQAGVPFSGLLGWHGAVGRKRNRDTGASTWEGTTGWLRSGSDVVGVALVEPRTEFSGVEGAVVHWASAPWWKVLQLLPTQSQVSQPCCRGYLDILPWTFGESGGPRNGLL